ncbi:hypothetical protein ACCO45_012475 [Purpureocillium lilacinum]|uniref:Uncharacterized protein n=1 Tax=Purpureocillium lilacinum TaxID=33203 RepID=A0ACC4D9Q4_PURLI
MDAGSSNPLPASSGFAAVFETGGTSVLQLHLKLRPNDDLTVLAILKSATRFFRFTAGANPRSGPLLFRRDSYTYTRNPFAWPGRQMPDQTCDSLRLHLTANVTDTMLKLCLEWPE